MKHGTWTMIAAGVLLTSLVACKSKIDESPKSLPPAPVSPAVGDTSPHPGMGGEMRTSAPGKFFTGTVAETMNSGGYTYVQVDNGKEKIWAAAPQFETKKGEKVTVPEGMPMKNYESKTLNRTFDQIFFVGSIGKGDQPPAPLSAEAGKAMMEQSPMPEGAHPKMDPSQAAKDAKVSFAGIKKADKTVGEVFSGQSGLGGKEVAVRGKVVKFSAQIMGKNWLHVQDGTGQAGANDLTITTNDNAKVGDTVLVSGKITLNKDFGMGYKYDLIIEDGKVKVE